MKRNDLVVAHFPSLYPDELLYSGIARYHQMSGNTAQKHTVRELFGDRLVCATVDLPSHLRHLSERLGSVYSVQDLIINHTLYPYYRVFISPEKAEYIFNQMSEGMSWGEVHIVLGIPASLIKLPTHLRFCSSCYAMDISIYHEPYWRRSHQIPGVIVCPMHKVPLIESTVPYTTREQKFGFIPLSGVNTAVETTNIKIDSDLVDLFTMVAERSCALLQLDKVNINCSIAIERCLHNKGYMTKCGRIRFLRLIRDFTEYFSKKFLQYVQCQVSESQSETWLHKMFRGKDLMFHPLRHILVTSFLGINFIEEGNASVSRQGPQEKAITDQLYKDRVDIKRIGTTIKDWSKRDKLALEEVKKAVMVLRSQVFRPQRITLAAVSRNLDSSKVPFVLEKSLDKLPLTKYFLTRELETTEHFQIRRLESAALHLKDQGELKGWILLKIAGLNKPLKQAVQLRFTELISD